MAGLSDLFGENGVIEQLLLWGVVAQVISSLAAPGFTELQQDAASKFPNVELSPEVLAQAVARHLVDKAPATHDAARSGIDAHRFQILLDLAQVRISPADLAEAVLRSYMTADQAQAQALPQGVGPAEFKILTDLAGDAPAPQQLVEALKRGIIDAHGRGPESTSYAQGIAETRLHNKWGPVLEALATVLLTPPEAAAAVVRGFISDAHGERVAAQQGLPAATFATLVELAKVRLSPPDAASAVVRGFLGHDHAEAIASESGVTPGNFATMVELAGEAPSPGQLAEALRRKLIPEHGGGPDGVSFVNGIREGRLANKWTDMIRGLSQIWPTPIDALDALLKGQVSEHEARHLYERFGGDPEFFTLLFNTRGSSPTPLELIDMANRGFIPWEGLGPDATTYAQGFREGPWKNKWQPVYRKYARYLPPPSTVVTLLGHGAIGQRRATELLAEHGMDDRTIAAFLDEADTEALSDYRGLTVTTVLGAYHAQLISHKDATVILEALHVTANAAALLLAYTDVQRGFQAVGNAIARIRSLFAARKITAHTARESLKRLDVPATSIESIMSAWEVENSISVKTLTEAQIIAAWSKGILTDTETAGELTNIGYTPFDAWVLMSTKVEAPLPGKPEQGPPAVQAQVRGGTT